jgi:Nucleotidyl transferase of unknown function (DUF2204)
MPGHQDMPLPVSSSFEPVFADVQEGLYREVLVLLNRREIPYAVSGAFALQQHTGIWRVTKDLDLFLTAEAAQSALATLREEGFRCEICDPVWLAKAHREDFFVDLITGMSNAAVSVDDSWIARARPAVVVGVTTRVLAAEELIASKLFVTRRERFDGSDITHIIYGARGELDWKRILELIGEHWQVLYWALVLYAYVYPAYTDFVPRELWQELTSRFLIEVITPDPRRRFRGSLVDDKMYAIDVNEWRLDDILSEYRERAPKLQDDTCMNDGLPCDQTKL